MQDFIVLGIIPGTNYQTTFTFWASIAGALICLPFVSYAWRRRASLQLHLVAFRIAYFIDQYEFRLPA